MACRYEADVHILLLEDSEMMGATVAMALQTEGHEIFHALTIASAFDSLQSREFDVAMLDVEIGDELSFDFARHLVDIGLRFFFSSARDPSLMPEGLSSRPYLRKPYELKQLFRMVNVVSSA